MVAAMAPLIYLLEDDDGLRELLAEVLREELEARLEVCATMVELQAHCQTGKPDLIVADFWGTSHLILDEAEREEIGALATIAPLVLVSARNWALGEQAADLGVVALLTKPLDIDGFVVVLRSALATPLLGSA
jgi:AmiR/NasT family two-component response regulator